MSDKPTDEQWRRYITDREKKLLPIPNYVSRYDGAEIMAWDDVPEQYQKKILDGTMTNADWNADWDYRNPQRGIEDVVSGMLNSSPTPVAKHTHVWRKEYNTCMLKGCGAVRNRRG